MANTLNLRSQKRFFPPTTTSNLINEQRQNTLDNTSYSKFYKRLNKVARQNSNTRLGNNYTKKQNYLDENTMNPKKQSMYAFNYKLNNTAPTIRNIHGMYNNKTRSRNKRNIKRTRKYKIVTK